MKRWNQNKCVAPLTSWKFASSPPGQCIKRHYTVGKREKYRWEIVQWTVPLTSKTEGAGPKNSEWNGERTERIQRAATKSTVVSCGPCSSHWKWACWRNPSTTQLGINACHRSGLKQTSLVPLRKYFNWMDWIPVWKPLGGEMGEKQPWYDSGSPLHGHPSWRAHCWTFEFPAANTSALHPGSVFSHCTKPIAALFCTSVRSVQLNSEVPHMVRR